MIRKFAVILNTDTEEQEGEEIEYEFPYIALQHLKDLLGTLEVELKKKSEEKSI